MTRKPIDQDVLDVPEFWMILDHLEEMHPEYLSSLLRDGSLGKVLVDRLKRYIAMLVRLQESMPNEPMINLVEIVQAEPMPNYQDQKELDPSDRKLLKQFKENPVM